MAEETASEYDDFSQADIGELADKVSQELCSSSVVDVPMLTKEQELDVMKQIVRVVFEVLTTSEEERRTAWISSNIGTGRDLLTSPERRKQVAKAINQAVDIPLLGEDQEEAILEAAIEQCVSTLEKLLPPDLLRTLKGESPEGLSEMKDFLIETVNQRVDLVGFSEDQEASIIRSMVNMLIDEYANDMETEMLLLSHEEQQEKLQEKVAELEWEIKAGKARFQREQVNLQAQLDRIKAQLD